VASVLGVFAVVVDQGGGGGLDVGEPGRVRVGEQPPPDDLEGLLGVGRAPLVGDPPHHVLQRPQRGAAVRAADLLVVGDRLLVGAAHPGIPGGGDRDHQEDPGGRPGRLGEGLRERELGVERAAWQALGAVQLPGVGHPLVDQDDRRGVPLQQVPQRAARVGRAPVGVFDHLVPGGGAELPGDLSPQGAYPRPAVPVVGFAGLDLVADHRHPPDPPGHRVQAAAGQ
jgi:hypothetical protein